MTTVISMSCQSIYNVIIGKQISAHLELLKIIVIFEQHLSLLDMICLKDQGYHICSGGALKGLFVIHPIPSCGQKFIYEFRKFLEEAGGWFDIS